MEPEKIQEQLQELQKQLGKKQFFEDSVASIHSLLQQFYPSASPPLRNSFYTVICRVATVLRTRYTAPGFWLAGLRLFELAEALFCSASEKQHLKSCIADARLHLHEIDNPAEESPRIRGGYLFEGHLTVDPEPPQPLWMTAQQDLFSAAALLAAQSSQTAGENQNTPESAQLLQDLIERLDNVIPEFLDDGTTHPRVPPASKEVVAKLPVIKLTEEILGKLGEDAECAICKESLQVDDEMQELPCKHTFHPPCLKPWLDEHNSCPICRHELKTDDHAYESWKEREKEAEEERQGAANAVRGGEYMYV